MHKGKHYCYHPEYWAAVGWFWPGYIPWRMKLIPVGAGDSPWDPSNITGSMLSWAGIPAIDRTSMAYKFLGSNPYGPLAIDVTLDTVVISGTRLCRWRATIGNGSAGWGTAFALQVFPQTVCRLDTWDYTLPNPPYLPPSVARFQLVPAVWAESGSPYPPIPHP
jgi:hypothetical protein